jgi:Fe-S-cluster-containing dehydrogenase component
MPDSRLSGEPRGYQTELGMVLDDKDLLIGCGYCFCACRCAPQYPYSKQLRQQKQGGLASL